ncbi:hypothetical protein BCR35DRAFT_304469 [Leucosporidium creatinivorum]|uniref:Uncharacterized protein n=1 Tax=Leucosporidium creatinivorum TaxID=106004 RepID=A0A1Y2FBN3_9BASI|nr:hypothetical protein BCR35DRAFT_304469 [Leucosporidium creatinivorum]
MPSTLGPSSFRPRQASYLRISPHTVLQMIMYLEPAHVNWMTTERLERVLFALKERIPVKLTKDAEGAKKRSGAKEKANVDVYRGADYQIAFFFRKTGQKHVVLLKDKSLAHPLTDSPPPAPLADTATDAATRKRGRDDEGPVDLTQDLETAEPPAKRAEVAELVAVKDEEVEAVLPPWEEGQGDYDDYKPELSDVKPELRVDYRGYSIFNRSLVVIVEPYPALAPSELAQGAPLVPAEVRQLSAMPSDSARLSASRGPSASATPGPMRRDGQPLFRSDTTPLEEGTPSAEDDMHALRETSEMLASEWDAQDDEELPAPKEIGRR